MAVASPKALVDADHAESAAAHPVRLSRDLVLALPNGALSYASVDSVVWSVWNESEQPIQPKKTLPIVLLHGWLDSWRSFSKLVPLLSRRHRTIALSFRGWGDSSKRGSYTIESYAEDVIAAADELGLGDFVLGAHNMGGLVATLVAARYPTRVKGLVLLDTCATVRADMLLLSETEKGGPVTIGDLKVILDSWGTAPNVGLLKAFQAEHLKHGVTLGTVDAAFQFQAVRETMKADPTVFAQTLADMIDEDHSEELSKISAPVLLVYGEHEELFPFAEQDAFASTFTSAAVVERLTLAGAGTVPHWSHYNECAEAILKFLEN